MDNEKLIGRKGLAKFQCSVKCPADKGGLCSKKNVFTVLAKPQLAKGNFLKDLRGTAFQGAHSSHVHSLRIKEL